MGKIPSHPEFLSTRTTREPELSFDGWLEGGMGLANHRYGPAWTAAFELGAVQGFVWRAPRASRCDTLLCGVMFPSCDSVGRHYPLAVVCDVPQVVVKRAPHVVPLAFGGFLERAHDAVADFPALAPSELAARLLELGPPSSEDVARAVADYEGWCHSTPVGSAWSAIFTDHPVERSRAIIEDLRVVTATVRGVEAPARAPSIRLPLGAGGPASASLWLDVVRRVCAWNETVPSAFWAVTDGSLVIALGDADAGVLSALWYRDSGGENVYDVGVGFDASPASLGPGSLRSGETPEVRSDRPMSELLASLTR